MSLDAIEYHKLTRDIIVPDGNESVWLSDTLLQLAQELETYRKDKDLLEELWLINSFTLVQGVKQFGQSNIANILGVNQSVVSQRYRTCKVVSKIIRDTINYCQLQADGKHKETT